MKKIIFSVLIVSTTFACKKNAEIKTDAPVKYYFKIAPISIDGSKNDTTGYKTKMVD